MIAISPTFFPDLADGTFEIYGENVGLGTWGSNRAVLTIETNGLCTVPALPAAGRALLAMLFAATFRFTRRAGDR